MKMSWLTFCAKYEEVPSMHSFLRSQESDGQMVRSKNFPSTFQPADLPKEGRDYY